MEQRILSDGGSGLSASALCLGTMHFGTTVDERRAFAILDRFTDAGGTFIDTANTYAFWVPGGTGAESEELLGRWLASRRARHRVVLATKVGALPDPLGATWPQHAEGLSHKVVRAQAEARMRRLGTDHLDVYFAHIEDRRTPLEDTVATFASLVTDGLVRVTGCSNHAAWRIANAREIARTAGLPGFTCVQQRHSYLRPRPGAKFGANPHIGEGRRGRRFGGVCGHRRGRCPGACPSCGVFATRLKGYRHLSCGGRPVSIRWRRRWYCTEPARSNLAELLAAMGVLGFGLGSFSAAMPGVILAVTPKSETSSAMSSNYVVRSVGYSLGSAIGGLILAAGTGPGHLFPDDSAYTTAALVGIGAMAITTLTSLALARRRSPETNPITAPSG
jgi:hypothetical protein